MPRAADAASSAVAHETIVRRAQVDVARARQEFSESKSKALQEQSRTHNDLVSELEQAHDKARLADARRRSEISREGGAPRRRFGSGHGVTQSSVGRDVAAGPARQRCERRS